MSAPLADAPRVEIEDAISGKPFLSLTWHRLMPHHVEVEAWGTHDRLVRRLDRAGLAKLRDACNALLAITAHCTQCGTAVRDGERCEKCGSWRAE